MDRLDRRRLADACRQAAGEGTVVAVRRLHGGASESTSAVRLVTADTRRTWLVLRRFTESPHRDAGEKARCEHAALAVLEGRGVPAPRPLWVDPAGAMFGVPAVIETRQPGRAWCPTAFRPAGAAALGRALAAIHRVPPPPELPAAGRWVRRMLAEPARWRAAHPMGAAVWEALASAGSAPLTAPASLLHGDYHAGNVLWRRGRLSGVVDWESAERGPPGSDLGYCRMDCTIAGGPRSAEALTEGYGRAVADLWFWELLAAMRAAVGYRAWLPAWRQLGMVALDGATVRRRLDAFVADALRRAS